MYEFRSVIATSVKLKRSPDTFEKLKRSYLNVFQQLKQKKKIQIL